MGSPESLFSDTSNLTTALQYTPGTNTLTVPNISFSGYLTPTRPISSIPSGSTQIGWKKVTQLNINVTPTIYGSSGSSSSALYDFGMPYGRDLPAGIYAIHINVYLTNRSTDDVIISNGTIGYLGNSDKLSDLTYTPQKTLGYRSLPPGYSIEECLNTTLCIDNDLLDTTTEKHVFLTYTSDSPYLNEIISDTNTNYFTIIRIG